MHWQLVRCQCRGERVTILTGIGHSREVQADELKLGHVAFLVSMEDLQGEVTRLVYLGLR